MKKTIITVGSVFLMLSCAGCHKSTIPQSGAPSAPGVVMDEPASFMPKASVFKMSGPYADKVAVTLVNGQLTYFPAPGDISQSSQPVYIGDGWWLNNQGLSANSVFTDWTFDQYAALPSTPSPSEIKNHIIPGAQVTDFQLLTIPIGQAEKNLKQVKAELGLGN